MRLVIRGLRNWNHQRFDQLASKSVATTEFWRFLYANTALSCHTSTHTRPLRLGLLESDLHMATSPCAHNAAIAYHPHIIEDTPDTTCLQLWSRRVSLACYQPLNTKQCHRVSVHERVTTFLSLKQLSALTFCPFGAFTVLLRILGCLYLQLRLIPLTTLYWPGNGARITLSSSI
jgi:hypothetical protein